jgi:hypothetical protein
MKADWGGMRTGDKHVFFIETCFPCGVLRLRLSGGFDKIAGDDSSFEDLHDLLEDNTDGMLPTQNIKEQMNHQVEETAKTLERMSRVFARATERAERMEAQEKVRRRAAGLPDSSRSSSHTSFEDSSGIGAEDKVHGSLDDYFERIPQPSEDSSQLGKGRGRYILLYVPTSLILLYASSFYCMCPHTTKYASSYFYMCPH